VNLQDQQRNLAWKYNWWRQSEMEGSLLLGRMVGTVDVGAFAARLTRHCAEEAEHSRIWSDVIQELGLPHVRIFRSYQSFYIQHGGTPRSLLEVLSFTQIFERRVHARFHQELNNPDTPEPARLAYRRMMDDEKDHLSWVAAWLREQAGAEDCLDHYRIIDELVFAELEPFAECLWEIPKLGCDSLARIDHATQYHLL